MNIKDYERVVFRLVLGVSVRRALSVKFFQYSVQINELERNVTKYSLGFSMTLYTAHSPFTG